MPGLMRVLSIVPFLVSLAPLACGDDKNTTHSESSGSAASEASDAGSGSGSGSGSGETGSAGTDGSTTGTPTTSLPTTGMASTEVGESTADTGASESDGTGTTGAVGCSGDAPRVLMVTTLGEMVFQLDAVNAPVTTANFLEYVEAGFYDDTIFHRVIDGFVIQGGGFTAGLVQKPTNPPIPLEVSPALTHVDGAIAMARTQDPDSATSQFYVCDGPQPGLDGMYAAFGALVEGADVLAAISAVAVHDVGDYGDVPVEDVVVTMAYCVQ